MGVDKIITVDANQTEFGGFFGNRVTCDNLDISVPGIEHVLDNIENDF